MSEEVLSQSEIDALLSAISSGEMDADELKKEEKERKVKVYDFKRALRFSKDQIRGITRIHENFARLLATFLSGQMRTYININVASVDQIPYEEFIRSVPKKTILNVFSVAPLEGRLLFEINPNIAYAMLDRVLGGAGTSLNKVDNLTEIETKIMSNIFERAMDSLREAWGSIIDIEPSLEEFEVNPQFLQLVSPNETVVVISLNTTIGEASGMINICIPHIVLEPIISKLSVHYWMQDTERKANPKDFDNISKGLKSAPVEVKAVLGESTITIEEFLNLAENDVIQLDQSIENPLKLLVNNEPKFYVQPGKSKNKMAVQILEEMSRGELEDES
ncbi:flagellar motor switch protein FliM [Melghiribacillus thermohalophilus]|uniref:Flagellar motor switch protein FliM n=1 Tax=Melghiribacillus thermohalophilus TaxID=1324956 RepID=A0A4R3NCQ3_9BACI|nr:flagellar motor switch protein FliM [Melghiribacillus thermohalophilus]TCT26763.1 flagellar motor switch protein FliM [Melghiribacillus thermohalophilus]